MSTENDNTTHDKPVTDGSKDTETIDRYNTNYPSNQNAIDLYKNAWASVFPGSAGVDTGGYAGLFNDNRIDWMVKTLGGVKGKTILDLGPLEGGHAYSLETKHEAAEITAIEANESAYMKCLIAKEVLGMQKSKFLLGDFNKFMEDPDMTADVIVASGILYHMDNPAEHIKLLCQTGEIIFVWTHYYDKEMIEKTGDLVAKKFNHEAKVEYEGYKHTLYQQDYLDALGWEGFCGAGKAFANWITKDDIYTLFEKYGFEITDTAFDDPEHIHGPAFAFIAKKK